MGAILESRGIVRIPRESSEISVVVWSKGGVTYWILGGATVGSRNLGTKLGEAGIVILIHCAIMLLKILNVYCLK